jgi:hypothetical protein
MAMMRRVGLLALLAGSLGAVVLFAAPATAAATTDVNCSDLRSQDAAQTYFDGRTSDADRLDADSDGRACEANDPHSSGTWSLVGLAVLFAAGLARYTTIDRRRAPKDAEAATPVEPVAEPVAVGARLVLVTQASDSSAAAPGHRNEVLASASTGTLGELARALRVVPYGERMSLLESHASAHGTPPKDVLAELAAQTTDLELQGWALAGYDPPWTVRVMRCSCVDGLRNFQLAMADDGTRYWACASCHQPVRTTS